MDKIKYTKMSNSWKPVSKVGLGIGVLSAVAFWIHALVDEDGFLLLDHVNLPFHEFGHLLFGPFGETLGVWGGTIMQLLVPFVILLSFFIRRETAGVAFSTFWFGENFLNISIYIADARKLELPLVGSGGHDWNIILSDIGMLKYDTGIACVVKALGWLIMLSSVVWLLMASLKSKQEI
ncbi:MAG: hypothetical protein QMD07_00515 [Thermodesulfovibrionales bacterium]|nr:hypothetical protein [Thermodesulfovibrionales bacterium]